MTQDLLQLISNEMKGFSKGQKRIGAFILEHYDKAAFMTAAKLGVHIFEYTPSQVKQAVVGYGKAEKRQVMDMTKRILHLSAVPKPDDAADAVAIALCHARSHTSRLTRFGL